MYPSSQATFPTTNCEMQPLPQWFAFYTTARHEKKVAQHLNVREIEVFLPTYRPTHRWKNGVKVELELPLFPSYIFARVSGRQQVRVLEVPGVLSLVGSRNAPTPLADDLIESLRSTLPLLKCEPHPYLKVGERVRVHSGPLAGMVGVLVRKKNDFRIVLTVDLIMQSVAVEVDASQVEPESRIPSKLSA